MLADWLSELWSARQPGPSAKPGPVAGLPKLGPPALCRCDVCGLEFTDAEFRRRCRNHPAALYVPAVCRCGREYYRLTRGKRKELRLYRRCPACRRSTVTTTCELSRLWPNSRAGVVRSDDGSGNSWDDMVRAVEDAVTAMD